MSDKLRLRFEKTGRAVYISHLDLMRTLQRSFNRAGLPLKYSEGFNPHPQIAIALPLSVGTGSLCEIMDFKLKAEETPDLAALPERLNAALPEGIRVTEAYEFTRKVAELKWLEVRGVFEYDERDPAEMAAKLTAFYAGDPVVITKKTKRGLGQTDIRPGIREIRFEAGDKLVNITTILSAQEPTINPELLAEALRQLRPDLAPDFAKFTRIETYDTDGKVYR
ncbi:MAG: TIGR03936 family radical SAM-associated protein [Oscillospiraceae bacterium]|nr:TIGR03936 family radical SAM-associated protein [Oscillospiraceae bacterium]